MQKLWRTESDVVDAFVFKIDFRAAAYDDLMITTRRPCWLLNTDKCAVAE